MSFMGGASGRPANFGGQVACARRQQPSFVVSGRQKVGVERPRVGAPKGKEVRLDSYEQLQNDRQRLLPRTLRFARSYLLASATDVPSKGSTLMTEAWCVLPTQNFTCARVSSTNARRIFVSRGIR